jgi:hypothetical protein
MITAYTFPKFDVAQRTKEFIYKEKLKKEKSVKDILNNRIAEYYKKK